MNFSFFHMFCMCNNRRCVLDACCATEHEGHLKEKNKRFWEKSRNIIRIKSYIYENNIMQKNMVIQANKVWI